MKRAIAAFLLAFPLAGGSALAEDCSHYAPGVSRSECEANAAREQRWNNRPDRQKLEYWEQKAREEARRQEEEAAQAAAAQAEHERRMAAQRAEAARLDALSEEADRLIRQAQAQGGADRYDDCIRSADQAIAIAGHSTRRTAQALSAAGLCHLLKGEFPTAETRLKKALAAVEREHGRADPATLDMARQLAKVYRIMRRPAEAGDLLAAYGIRE